MRNLNFFIESYYQLESSLKKLLPPGNTNENLSNLNNFKKDISLSSDGKSSGTLLSDELFNPCCSTSGGEMIFYGDEKGIIRVFDHLMNLIMVFQAFNNGPVKLMHFQELHLVVCGEEEHDPVEKIPFIKVWGFKDLNLKPEIIYSQKLLHGNRYFPVLALSTSEDLDSLTVGLENGVVYYVRGFMQKQVKPTVIYEASTTITGLHFIQYQQNMKTRSFKVTSNKYFTSGANVDEGANSTVATNHIQNTNKKLIVCTLSEIILIDIPSSSFKEIKIKTIDAHGCALKSSVASSSKQEVFISQNKTIYSLNAEGKGAAYPIDGLDPVLGIYDDYLLVSGVKSPSSFTLHSPSSGYGKVPISSTSREKIEISSSPSSAATPARQNNDRQYHLVIFNFKNKFIAFEKYNLPPIRTITPAFGQIWIVFETGELLTLTELDVPSKLQLLFDHQQFVTAVEMFDNENEYNSVYSRFQYNVKTEIHKRYGDYLYSKTNFDAAMEQYIQTIPYVPSSYVLLKYMDAERICDLMAYLQALHEKNVANKKHTTLLIHCFAKMGDLERLESFLEGDFDVDAVLNVLTKYPQQALRLAKKAGREDIYVSILMQNSDFQVVVDYLKTSQANVLTVLKEEGSELMKHYPEEMTELAIKDVCKYERIPNCFYHLFLDYSIHGIKYLEAMIQYRVPSMKNVYPDQVKEVCNMLIEFYLNVKDHENKLLSLLKDKQSLYDPYQALCILSEYRFEQGLLYVYERLQQYHDILEYHMDRMDKKAMLQCCLDYGEKDKSLWIKTLQFMAKNESQTSLDEERELVVFMQKMDSLGILSPLEILFYLSQDTGISIGAVKSYFIKKSNDLNASVLENKRFYQSYREETKQLEHKLKDLQTKPIIFQSTECFLCHEQLEAPSLHFLCKHAYHVRCVQQETMCPLCKPDYDMLKELAQSKPDLDMMEQLFRTDIEGGSPYHRLDIVADYFSKNLF